METQIPNFEVGRTIARVMVRRSYENGKKGEFVEVKRGTITKVGSSFVTLYGGKDAGDADIKMATEWFAINGPDCYVERVGEQKYKLNF